MKNVYSRECPYIYRGIVESNIDPEELGRCRIRVPSVHGTLSYPIDMLPWARPIVLSPVGKGKGSVNLPDIGDIVWVFFEGANKDFPVYLGGTYATGDVGINPNEIDFYTENGDKISYRRDTKIYKITIGNSEILIYPDSSIKLVGDTVIEGSLTVKGDLKVSGHTTLSDLTITGVCNKEGNHK